MTLVASFNGFCKLYKKKITPRNQNPLRMFIIFKKIQNFNKTYII